MKKLILTTSALTLMGVASSASASDFDISAEASVAYGNWETGAGAASFDFDTGITIGLEASSGGLTWGAEVGIDADAGTVSDGVVWVSGGFGKVSFGIDEFDELSIATCSVPKTGPFTGTCVTKYDTNGSTSSDAYGDVKYEGEFGAVSVTLVADAGVGRVLLGGPLTWDLALAYAGNGFNASLDTDSSGDWDLAADTTFGNFTVGAAVDEASVVDVWASTTFGAINAKVTADDVSGAAVYGLELDGSSGNMSWAVSDDSGGATTASISFDADPWTASLAFDNDDAGSSGCTAAQISGGCRGIGVVDFGDAADVILTIGYAANDAVSFEVLANDQSEYEISMTAGFTF